MILTPQKSCFFGNLGEDMIAIPDFSAGAMENWGLVTYREVALLCDESTVSATQKHRICTVPCWRFLME